MKKRHTTKKKLQVKGTRQAAAENNASEWLDTVIYWNTVKKGMQTEEMQHLQSQTEAPPRDTTH